MTQRSAGKGKKEEEKELGLKVGKAESFDEFNRRFHEQMTIKEPGLRKKREDLLKAKNSIVPLDMKDGMTVAELVSAYGNMSFQGRQVHTCANIWEMMLNDPERPTIMLGLAGALIAGGLRKLLVDCIKNGMVDVIVSTGAIMYQDLYQAQGYKHYKGTPTADDTQLNDLMIDRIYDTYVDEEKFRETDFAIGAFASKMTPRKYSTREFMAALADFAPDQNGIVYNAAKYGVPIFIPAIADSSIGIGLMTLHKYVHERTKRPPEFALDTIRDNHEIAQITALSSKTAAIYIGGGVPKNYINDAVVMADMMGSGTDGHEYAFQITMDRAEWGGLSGSTLAEAQSWGKIDKAAKKCMAYVETTIGLSLIYGYVYQRGAWKGRNRLAMKWDGEVLKAIDKGAAVPGK